MKRWKSIPIPANRIPAFAYWRVSGNCEAGDTGNTTCRPASRSAATPIRQRLLLGVESLFGAGSALRLIRPTSNSRTPSLIVKSTCTRGCSSGRLRSSYCTNAGTRPHHYLTGHFCGSLRTPIVVCLPAESFVQGVCNRSRVSLSGPAVNCFKTNALTLIWVSCLH